jgi:hypothetical protein
MIVIVRFIEMRRRSRISISPIVYPGQLCGYQPSSTSHTLPGYRQVLRAYKLLLILSTRLSTCLMNLKIFYMYQAFIRVLINYTLDRHAGCVFILLQIITPSFCW